MRTFAVGDIQGCYKPLRQLLDTVKFDPSSDELWVAGDLVNRGPDSLHTLRYLKGLGTRCKVVLGNHDLHLLAVASGAQPERKSDTLTPILLANDRDELLDWLRRRPLIHQDSRIGFTMVHAGIPPCWTLRRTLELAREVEKHLDSNRADVFLAHMYGDKPRQWNEELSGFPRLRCIVNYLTRMRFCTAAGELDLKDRANMVSARPGFLPWFEHKNPSLEKQKIVFGHWAALQGKVDHPNIHALDTGCVWGGQLTLLQLDNEHLFSQDCSTQ